jgi:hypothetical protein
MLDFWNRKQPLLKVWRRCRRLMSDRQECRRQRREQAAARRKARVDEAIQQGIREAQVKLIVQELDEDYFKLIVEEVYRRKRPELEGRCLEELKAAHAGELSALKEQLRDEGARHKKAVEREADRLIEEGITRGIADERLDYDERIARLKVQRDEARNRANLAESLLVHIMKELVGDRRVYLFSGGNGIHQFPLHTLNSGLARHGLTVKAKQTASERQVACQIDPQNWADRSLFWIDTIMPQEALPDGR